MHYRDYIMYMRVFPDSDWQFITRGRICFKCLKEYDKCLAEIRRVLNENSVYEFNIIPFYDKDMSIQLEIPY